jgi:hypothetical protein
MAKKYMVGVSGWISLTVDAENEDEAFEKISSVCSAEKSLPEVGIPETDGAKAILELRDWEIDVTGEVQE